MWIFTKHGFFSVVCARRGDGSHSQPVEPEGDASEVIAHADW